MKFKYAVIVAAAGLLAPLVPIAAHHSFAAEYDANKPVKLTGKVTKVEWTNPHARFYIDVADANGKVTNWNLELGSPNVLKRSGWGRTDLKEGDSVTVEGSQAKDGSYMANARTVVMSTGRRLFAGSSQGDGK
ncbi:MAG: DUF6152 family protein [Acidobacteriota bacterium]